MLLKQKTLLVLLAALTMSVTASAAEVHVQLASIDAGVLLRADRPEVIRMKLAFDRAQNRCVAQNGLAEQVNVTRRELVARGAPASNVEILEGLAGVLLGARTKPQCSSILATYASFRTGKDPELTTHTGAVLVLRAMAKDGALGFEVK